MKLTKFTFEPHGDNRGQLIAIEGERDIPFVIRRVYYIFDTKAEVRRGFHAHKNLEQILVCVHGSCKVLLDDGRERETVVLSSPDDAIYVANDMWREMYDFSDDAVLLVLASEPYDERDYIRDYDDFIQYVNERSVADERAVYES